MADANSYPAGTPSGNTRLIGTQLNVPQAGGLYQNQTRNFTIGSIASVVNQVNLGYTTYVATITQTGTNAPVANEIQNTTGGTIAWTYSTPGRYVATIENATFTANKTAVFLSSASNNDRFIKTGVVTTTTVDIYNIRSVTGLVADGISANTAIEIRIYA